MCLTSDLEKPSGLDLSRNEAWKCAGIFLCTALGVFLYLSYYMFRGIDPTDSSMHLFAQQLAGEGVVLEKLWFFTSLVGSWWLKLSPTPNVWGWAALGGAILLALSAGVGSLIVRKLLRVNAIVLVLCYLAAFISIPIIKVDFIINYYTLPLLLTLLYLLLFCYAVEREKNIWLWLVLGALGALIGFGRLPAVVLNVLPLVYLAIKWCYAKAKMLPAFCFPWRAAGIYLGGFIIAVALVLYIYWRVGFFAESVNRMGFEQNIFEVLRPYLERLLTRSISSVIFIAYGWLFIFVLKGRKIQIVGLLLPIILVILFWAGFIYSGVGSSCHPYPYYRPYWRIIQHLNGLVFLPAFMVLISPKLIDFFPGKKGEKLAELKCLLLTVVAGAPLFALGSNTGNWKIYYVMPLILTLTLVLLVDYWKRDRQKLFIWGLIAGLMINGIVCMFCVSFRDGLKHRMSGRFSSPQLSWMISTPERVELYDRAIEILSKHIQPGDTLQDFGNNYIFNSVLNVRPAVFGWEQWAKMPEFLLEEKSAPDFIFVFKPGNEHYSYDSVPLKDHILPILKEDTFPGRYTKIVDEPEFELYKKVSRNEP